MQGSPNGLERRATSGKMQVVAAVALLAILVAAALATSSSAAGTTGLQRAIQVQERNTDRLLARGAIVGTGVGVDSSGPEIVVLAKRRVRVAKSLGGIPVQLKVTGPISSLRLGPSKKPDNPGNGNGNGNGGGGGGEETETSLSPTDVFTRPVPIGVSTGNANECAAGTIGARVKDTAGNVYALSNNHVYARENEGTKESVSTEGDKILQPGRYDTGCSWSEEDVIGNLADFVLIKFGEENEVDAAIASIDEVDGKSAVGNATPANGYGTPSSSAVPALKLLADGDAAVKKYGRTTEETHGYAYATNGIVSVGYRGGTALFVNQVLVESRKGPFIKSGDSGSLLVTEEGNRPAGLLFAGSNSGKFAVANPIEAVLDAFSVTVDGS